MIAKRLINKNIGFNTKLEMMRLIKDSIYWLNTEMEEGIHRCYELH